MEAARREKEAEGRKKTEWERRWCKANEWQERAERFVGVKSGRRRFWRDRDRGRVMLHLFNLCNFASTCLAVEIKISSNQ